MRTLIPLLLLPLPILQLSVSLPKLSDLYNDPGFEKVIVAGLLLGGAFALSVAVTFLRGPRRLARSGWLALIVVVAAALAWNIFRTNPVRLAALREVVHIGEYGALGAVAMGVLRRRLEGLAGYVVTLSYAGCVGVVDELVQFYHPLRVGDLRDVGTNIASASLGLAFLGGVAGRRFGAGRAGAGLLSPAVGLLASATLGFEAMVGTGHLISDPECGSFRSRLGPDALLSRMAEGRVEDYRSLLSRERRKPIYALEDLYLSEAKGHVLVRDSVAGAAAPEDCILGRYFRPAAEALGVTRASPSPPAAPAAYESPYLKGLRTGRSRALFIAAFPVPLTLGVMLAWATRRHGP